MQRINLLYIITKLELGGAQKHLLSLISHLDKEKFQPFLFTAPDGLLSLEASSIDGLTVKKSIYLERPINPLKDLLALVEIYCFIKTNNIEIVHTHSSKAGILGRWAAKLARVKFIVHTVHGWSFNDYQAKLWQRFFIWLERLSAGFTDKLIVVSNYDRQKGLKHRIGNEDKYALIRYGIDYAEFSIEDQNIRKDLGISASDLVIGTITCFKPQKSPQDFIKLAFLLKNILPDVNPVRNTMQISTNKIVSNGVKFLLVGDGILRKKVERLIYKFNLQAQVILTGWCKDVSRILSAIDVFVLTSLWEGLPISVLEAMASSRPVIVSNTGGIAEVVLEGKTGFMVTPRDTKKMSERLISLLKDEALRRQIGQSAKDFLNGNYRLEKMVKDTENLYGDLVAKRSWQYAS